ncbi:vesicle transport through interaction with t-SNAREs homolog 1A [Diaphorina citri]|uniref:Vesicle transport through interaction with t-SNAREs homolog 1A n=1 Tax=Diaphorina citri TaxID=121845 RepID=A0A3Q0JAN7_DIACI|nr:vesicle transport through interaction with t-SNAREs homolog 1A [Diaphorina citri]
MWSLLENYEQQYAIVNADITSKIGKLKLLDQNDNGRRNIMIEIDKQIEEVQELMEQMDLEIREVDPTTRPKYKTRIDSYRAELERLSQEYSKAKLPKNNTGKSKRL